MSLEPVWMEPAFPVDDRKYRSSVLRQKLHQSQDRARCFDRHGAVFEVVWFLVVGIFVFRLWYFGAEVHNLIVIVRCLCAVVFISPECHLRVCDRCL